MGENSGHSSDFIERYLTRQSYSPEHDSANRTFNLSMQDDAPYSPNSKRSLQCQKILDRISTFCAKENLPQRLAFLDQELSVYGYPAVAADLTNPPSSSGQESRNGAVDLVTLVNVCYDLLRLWRQSIENQSNANDLQRTSDAEIVRLRHMGSRLKEDIANKDRDLKSKELMQLQLSQKLENVKKKLRTEQEKSKRLTSEMTARDTQFRHEKKKKVQEVEKLQSRLQQLLQDKRQERMLGIEILNSLQRSDGKRGKWSTDKSKKSNEQDMYRLIITNYEDSQKQLLKENEGMRKYLKEMQDELISALNERSINPDQSHSSMQGKTEGDEQPTSRSSSSASNRSEMSEVSEPMSDGMFEMPYDIVKEDIERSIRTKWRALKKEIRKSRKSDKKQAINKESPRSDAEYDDLVQQQQELIDYLTTGQGESNGRPIPEDCYFLEEKAELEKQRKHFGQEKNAFEKERQLYAEALLQLDEQRQEFETEKQQWFQKNFFNLTPFRNDGRPSSSPHQSRNKNPSSHQVKTRQQPYQTRSSVSPDKPGSKTSEQFKPNGNSNQPTHNMSQSLSRLHSSSQHNALSPEPAQQRIPEPSWSQQTPDQSQPHRAKSTSNSSIMPPTTAELYRSLGLVYYGSDKENEDMGNNAGNTAPVCPRTSGTPPHHFSSFCSPPHARDNTGMQEKVAQQFQGHQYRLKGHPFIFGDDITKRSFEGQNSRLYSRNNFHSQNQAYSSSKVQGHPWPNFKVHPMPNSDTSRLNAVPRSKPSIPANPHSQDFEPLPVCNYGVKQSWTTLDGHSRSNLEGSRSEGYQWSIRKVHPGLNFETSSRSKEVGFKVKENGQSSSQSPVYHSAASFDSDAEESASSDYFDAQKNLQESLKRGKAQKVAPKERNLKQMTKLAEDSVKKVPFLRNEFQLSGDVPKIEDFNYGNEAGKATGFENEKPKKSGLKSFMKSLLMGSPKPKRSDQNNNSTKLLSNSDSAIGLRYNLAESRDLNEFMTPSAGRFLPSIESNKLEGATLLSSTVENPTSNLGPEFTFPIGPDHQRTRSYPGSEILNLNHLKPRSFSCDSPTTLNASAERHKSGLLSASAHLRPKNDFADIFLQNLKDSDDGNATEQNVF